MYILNSIFDNTDPSLTLIGNTLAVVDLENNKALAGIPLPGMPNDLVISPDGKTVYVTTTDVTVSDTGLIDFKKSGKIILIDTATHTLTTSIPIQDEPPTLLAMHPDGSRLYIARNRFGSISTGPFPAGVLVMDTGNHQILNTIDLEGEFPRRMAIHPMGSTLYLAYFRDEVFLEIVDLVSEQAIQTIPNPVADPTVNDVRYSSDGLQVLVSVTLDGVVPNRIYVIDASSHSISDTVLSPPGSIPNRLATFVTVNDGRVPLAAFSSLSEHLNIPVVNVPGLGNFNASLEMTDPLVFNLEQAIRTGAPAEQPALFAPGAGTLSLPAVSVDGAAFFQADLKQDKPGEFQFSVTNATPLQ